MRSKWMFMIAITALAAGCTTITPEERRQADEAECRSYGFVRDNDAFAECLHRIELDRRAASRASLARDPWPPPQPRVIVVRR